MYAITLIIIITIVYVLVAMWRSISILLNYLKVRAEHKNSLEWRSVSGRITSSTVEEVVLYSRTKGNVHIYYPEINYLYSVNDKEYDGNRISFGANIGTSKRQEVSAMIKKYPESASVNIYYDPQGAANSVIERELASYYKTTITREQLKFIVYIIVFVVAGVYFLIL